MINSYKLMFIFVVMNLLVATVLSIESEQQEVVTKHFDAMSDEFSDRDKYLNDPLADIGAQQGDIQQEIGVGNYGLYTFNLATFFKNIVPHFPKPVKNDVISTIFSIPLFLIQTMMLVMMTMWLWDKIRNKKND